MRLWRYIKSLTYLLTYLLNVLSFVAKWTESPAGFIMPGNFWILIHDLVHSSSNASIRLTGKKTSAVVRRSLLCGPWHKVPSIIRNITTLSLGACSSVYSHYETNEVISPLDYKEHFPDHANSSSLGRRGRNAPWIIPWLNCSQERFFINKIGLSFAGHLLLLGELITLPRTPESTQENTGVHMRGLGCKTQWLYKFLEQKLQPITILRHIA